MSQESEGRCSFLSKASSDGRDQANTDEQIRSAIERDDLHDFAEALEHGADRKFAYREALMHGNAEMVKSLLSHGASPYASFYNSPSVEESDLKSCLTAALPSVEVTRLLLEAGVSPNSEDGWKERDWHYESVLSKAERYSQSDPAYLEVVSLLKEYAKKS